MDLHYLSERKPADFSAAQKKWERVKSKIEHSNLEQLYGDEADFFERMLCNFVPTIDTFFDKSCWGWAPVCQRRTKNKINRLGESFRGPLYTCEGYEWPRGNDGKYAEPIAQIDLDKCSKICKQAIGNGFIQVFRTSSHEYFTRTVPRSAICREKLIPIPDMGNNGDFSGWNENDYCLQVISFSKRIFTVPNYCPISDVLPIKEANPPDKPFYTVVEKLCSDVEKLIEKYPSSGTHLFGTYYGIQYQPQETDQPLICLDVVSDSSREDAPEGVAGLDSLPFMFGFGFGDGGNGQILMRKDDNDEWDFYFRWSCY